jgi:hypothetical protein
MSEKQPAPSTPEQKATIETAKKALLATLAIAKKLGGNAAQLYRQWRKNKSPEAVQQSIANTLAANKANRETLSAELEKQFAVIAAKKKTYETAPPARKRVLEAELKGLLAAYRSAEGEFKVLVENEQVLTQVLGRMREVTAYGKAGITEAAIDQLIDEVDERAEEAEGRVSAAADLEKAGRRRERESDRESFAEQLAGFDEPETSAPEPQRTPETPTAQKAAPIRERNQEP